MAKSEFAGLADIDWSALPLWVNDAYVDLWENWDRFNCIFGGSGSGKSVFITQRWVYRMLTLPGYNILTTRKHAVTNRNSTFAQMVQTIEQFGLAGYFNVTENLITACTGNQMLFKGLDDEEKIKSVTFKTGILQAVWMEEGNEFVLKDLIQLNLRMRGLSDIGFQLVISFNPISAYHWLKAYFIDSPPERCTVLHTTYKDNRFIDEDYKATLNALKGTAHQVYALGEWGITEGLVFTDFKTNEIPATARLKGYGLDFGYSGDPAALIAVWQDGPEDLYLDEVIYQTGLTNSDLSKKMVTLEISKMARIVADSVEPKSIEDLHRAGWNIHPAKKGADSINFGINQMKEFTLHLTPTSKNLIKEFYSYSWSKDKNGTWLPLPVDSFNHGIDGARYFIMDLKRGVLSVPKTNVRALIGV